MLWTWAAQLACQANPPRSEAHWALSIRLRDTQATEDFKKVQKQLQKSTRALGASQALSVPAQDMQPTVEINDGEKNPASVLITFSWQCS